MVSRAAEFIKREHHWESINGKSGCQQQSHVLIDIILSCQRGNGYQQWVRPTYS